MSSCRGVRARRRGDRSARAGTRGTQTRARRRAEAACRESFGTDTQERQRREEQKSASDASPSHHCRGHAERSRGRLTQEAGDPAAGHHVRRRMPQAMRGHTTRLMLPETQARDRSGDAGESAMSAADIAVLTRPRLSPVCKALHEGTAEPGALVRAVASLATARALAMSGALRLVCAFSAAQSLRELAAPACTSAI